ncbi:hypothetical protein H4R27_002505 [Coemansia aciculifera]|nr:hypothetical protein H4R27_002505 [Coemansia aciculifera]
MQRAKESDDFDFDMIVVVYVAPKGYNSSFYAFPRGAIINLDELLLKEERGRGFRGKVSTNAHLIRTQFNADFERIKSLTENSPYITEDCKYILVRNVENTDINEDNWSPMIYKDYLGYVF